MQRFEIFDARSLTEAASLLKEHGAKAQVLAGGGDLFSLMRNGAPHGGPDGPRVLVNLAAIPEIDRIRYEPGKGLTLGAMALLADIRPSAPSATGTGGSPRPPPRWDRPRCGARRRWAGTCASGRAARSSGSGTPPV